MGNSHSRINTGPNPNIAPPISRKISFITSTTQFREGTTGTKQNQESRSPSTRFPQFHGLNNFSIVNAIIKYEYLERQNANQEP